MPSSRLFIMSTRGVGFRHSSTTDDRLFPFSANVIRAIASGTLSPEDAAHLDSPAEVLRHLYYPKKRGIYMNNGSTHDVALVDRAADPDAPQLPRRLERCEELYKVCSPADVRYDFGYMDILPCGVIRDGSYVSEVTLRKPCYEVLRFDYTKTHAESLALAPSLLNIQEGSAREFLSRFSIKSNGWDVCSSRNRDSPMSFAAELRRDPSFRRNLEVLDARRHWRIIEISYQFALETRAYSR